MTANQENKAAHKEKGFTLVEILIALTIFAIGILGVASMQIWGLRGNASAIWHSQAATFAADRVERLMVDDYATLTAYADAPLYVNDDSLEDRTDKQGDYTITWEVETDNPIDNTATITVNVQWNDHGTVKNFTPVFTCYKADL